MNPDIAKALRTPFKPEQIGHLKKGGTTLDYVGHAEVTDRLLQVDPEWSWEPMPTPPGFDPAAGLWIRLTIGGVTRIGFGEASGGFTEGDKIKAAISDAIRNAAMRFGVALDLWMKEEHPQPTQSAPESRTAPSQRPYTQQTAGNNYGDLITDGQRKLVFARLKKAAIPQADWPEYLSTWTGRDVATIDELRKGDVDSLLEAIQKHINQDAWAASNPAADDMWGGENV